MNTYAYDYFLLSRKAVVDPSIDRICRLASKKRTARQQRRRYFSLAPRRDRNCAAVNLIRVLLCGLCVLVGIDIGFDRGLQGMKGEKSQNNLFLFRM